ncbi:4-hydroxy-tetrahydrodipicolinate reductase [Oleiagrimonas soli]|uniref:4-hydroxy-tetrahydrodipicolinate reductase n=1 Tax=Oleiagrimonas soli TaxID=1543381 RepID=A0A099CZ52_9GAMM|nr:4-hydroxy-tetrahydrodipicolinate reductase [Oleiagrimonas soli]KGI78315.1 dihydrodipicolinate reductase [Oleiagrimonas soli]MBB6183193.1 4-hydroxy-tetrahydrodipicolinate reductase [Oleiagrimonas soli]
MNQALRIAISGASGRMGSALIARSRGDRRLRVQRAVIDARSELVGHPLQQPATPDSLRYSNGWEGASDLDVVIDFSTPAGLSAALDYCLADGVPLVVGTTGYDAALRDRLDAASERIAVLQAANFSLGVAVLQRLLRDAARALPEWDLEIVEAHHGRKEDAPSGTAIALGEAAAKARGTTLEEQAVYAREGHPGPRRQGEIGFAVVRGGDIVGEHTALLAGKGERLELIHRATDRGIFARGALEAAVWLAAQPPGRYGIADMLEGRLRSAD